MLYDAYFYFNVGKSAGEILINIKIYTEWIKTGRCNAILMLLYIILYIFMYSYFNN